MGFFLAYLPLFWRIIYHSISIFTMLSYVIVFMNICTKSPGCCANTNKHLRIIKPGIYFIWIISLIIQINYFFYMNKGSQLLSQHFPLSNDYHFSCLKKISGLQPIKINSAWQPGCIKFNFILTGRFLFVNQSCNFPSQHIINFQNRKS